MKHVWIAFSYWHENAEIEAFDSEEKAQEALKRMMKEAVETLDIDKGDLAEFMEVLDKDLERAREILVDAARDEMMSSEFLIQRPDVK